MDQKAKHFGTTVLHCFLSVFLNVASWTFDAQRANRKGREPGGFHAASQDYLSKHPKVSNIGFLAAKYLLKGIPFAFRCVFKPFQSEVLRDPRFVGKIHGRSGLHLTSL